MIAYKNCNIFDGLNDKLQENMTVITDGKMITDIFPSGSKKVENVEVIDLTGFTLCPGFLTAIFI